MAKWVLLLILLVGVAGYEVLGWSTEPGPLESPVNVLIPKGAGSGAVARRLSAAGVIDKPWLFQVVGRINGLDKQLRAGEYYFMPQISMLDVMKKLAKGEIFYRKLTLPEGLTSAQMKKLIESEPALSGDISLAMPEGSMLPETYSFAFGDSRDSIVRQSQKAMGEFLQETWEKRQAGIPLQNADELKILASIVEKETGIADERGLVAAVFVNRLKKRMMLQTDPTVIYALTKGNGDLGRNLSRKDLQVDNPYNTYRNFGLPPTPICNPGKEAIMAAANPETSDYLYFVASGNGGHNFARSLNEHNQNVKNWRNSR